MASQQRLLELALMGLETERQRVDNEIAEIRSQVNERSPTAGSAIHPRGPAKKKTMSAEARKRISEGMKRRYAAMRQTSPPQSKQSQVGTLTAAGRRKLSALMKARWAAKRNAAKK